MSKPAMAQVPVVGSERVKLQNQDIICISVMDWDWPFPTSRHNLMREFARDNRILFVDPPISYLSEYRAMRSNTQIRNKLSYSMAGRLVQETENIFIFTPPPAVPFNRLPYPLLEGVLAVNNTFFARAVRRAARQLKMHNPILWISLSPYFGITLVGKLNEKLTIYHCTDEIGQFPGYSPRIAKLEQKLIKRSDLVITTSETLYQKKSPYNSNTFFVPNGANTDLFKHAQDISSPLPSDLSGIPGPRVGFIGQIEYRFDIDMLVEVARRRSQVSFVLIGPKKRGTVGIERLEAEPNIYFLGHKPQAVLPDYLRGLKVALIPYKSNELTRSIYPLKLHEYLAAGCPVVATPLPSLEQFQDVVSLASSPDEFVAALDRALVESADPKLIARRQAVAANHSWSRVATTISELIVDQLP